MKMTFKILMACILSFTVQATTLTVDDFETDLSQWDVKSFKALTDYEIIQEDDNQILQAVSEGTASGLIWKQDIDLEKTPYLNWRWKRGMAPVESFDETTKAGDDYIARIYVVTPTSVFKWAPYSVSYVWSANQDKATTWVNAYTSRVHNIAVNGAADPEGEWQVHKRNVAEDLQRIFGKNLRKIAAVAIMTDMDNTGLKATAFYDDIYFSSE